MRGPPADGTTPYLRSISIAGSGRLVEHGTTKPRARTRLPILGLGHASPTVRTPASSGGVRTEQMYVVVAYALLRAFAVNRPRSALRKREASPFLAISLMIAA